MPEIILPGTYVSVRDEGLISAGGVISGNIGVVGTAASGTVNKVEILGSLTEAGEVFGAKKSGLNLLDTLELIYGNGGRTVYAIRANSDTPEDYKAALAPLEKEIVNIVLLAGQDSSQVEMVAALQGHIASTSQIKRERIGLIGCATADDVETIAAHPLNSERVIFAGPGIKIGGVDYSGAYTAAALAGLLSSLPVQASPTNKTLNVQGLTEEFTSSELEKLVMSRVLAVEKRKGYRVVKGITTATNSAWHQITTRRIIDYATYGVRSCCDPYIGKLNNDRVRSAMKATIDSFLTGMAADEALVSYELEVGATRAQEIAGECIVTMTLRPTFSIDFIKVTMYLG
ncbi:MAG: phage tail sheath C-terminal domain-containing protein [Leptospirales bacterium]